MGIPKTDTPDLPFQIGDIELVRELGRGAQSVVYLGQRGPERYAIKLLSSTSGEANAEAARRFYAEAGILARCNHPNLVRILKVSDRGEPYTYIVMELLDGEPLASLLEQGPLEERRALEIALQVALGVREVHRFGLVHRDLKPKNIVICKDGSAKVIDFGLATSQIAGDDAGIVGTYLYSPPEQTGLLRRPVDHRSDLYSLGVILHECLTGQPPYVSSDPAEVMHLHLSRPVPDLHKTHPHVSEVTAKLVSILLAKDPDDRYRTTTALVEDLQLLTARPAGETSTIELRSGDTGSLEEEELPIVGREAELSSIKERLKAARDGKGQVVLIAGESGSGKSRLARELVREARSLGPTWLLASKASMSQSQPFGLIRELLNESLRRLALLPSESRAAVETRLREIIGDRAPLIVNFSPALKKIFENAEDQSVGSDQEQFHEAIADLLLALAPKGDFLTLFLDDVQWLDDSSRLIVERLAQKGARAPVLMLLSGREELGGVEEIRGSLARLAGDAYCDLRLGALDLFSTRTLIAACLGGSEVDEILLKNVYTRSNGNAFAVQQFVAAMISAGILLPSWGFWKLHAEGLETIRLPTDVIQLLLQRTANLSENARTSLKYAALLSERFDPPSLARVAGISEDLAGAALLEAFDLKLVETEIDGKLKFVHDKVRETFISLWSRDELARTHQTIGDLLFTRGIQDPQDLFAVANHYRQGLPEASPPRTFQVGFEAARAAFQNFADLEALAYFELADRAAGHEPKLRIADFEEAHGLCLFRLGRFLEAEKHFQLSVDLSRESLQRARVLSRMVSLATLKGNKPLAWKRVNDAFAELGVSPAVKGPQLKRQALLSFLASEFIDRFIGILPQPKNRAKVERLKVLTELSTRACFLAYFDVENDLMLLLGLRAGIWSRRIGTSRELCHAYCQTAYLAAVFRFRERTNRYTERAIQIARLLHDQPTNAAIKLYDANNWMVIADDELDSERRYRDALTFGHKWGDPVQYVNTASGLLQRLMRRGQSKDAFDFIVLALSRSDSPELKMEMLSYRLGALSFSGRIREASMLHREIEEYNRTRASRAFKALHTLNEGIYLLEQNETGEPVDRFLEEYDQSGFRFEKGPSYLRAVHVPALHLRLRQWLTAPDAERARRLAQVELALDQLWKHAGVGLLRKEPEDLIQAHHYYGRAVIAAAQEKWAEAQELLNRAETLAVRTDCPWVLFEVFRQRAALYKARGYQGPARQFQAAALNLAILQGWEGRANRLRKELDWSAPAMGGRTTSSASSTQMTSETGLHSLFRKQLDALLNMAVEASKVTGLEARCRVVLKQLIGLLNPERAFLLLLDKTTGETTLQIGQDSSGNPIEQFSQYSRTIIEKVRVQRAPFIVTGSDSGGELTSESIVAYDLRSILAAPLLVDQELIGVIYLDSRVAKGIFKEKDVQLLLAFGSHIAVAIETARAGQLELQKSTLEKDLEVAAAVQSLLLPKANSLRSGPIEAHTFFQTADRAGGDWWCFDETEDGKIRVLLGDVTGHGAGPAMLTAVVGSCYHTAKELLGKVEIPKLAEILNRALVHFCNDTYWMTFSVIEIDPQARKFHWWNMGAPPLFSGTPEGHRLVHDGKSVPLGSGELKCSHQEGSFEPGDQLMVFSDGLYEFKGADGREFGLKRLLKLHRESMAIENVGERVSFIAQRTAELRGTPRPPDDITLTIVEYKAKS